VDVRKNPLSRKFGFSKDKLQHVASTVGIGYVSIPTLGIESDKRKSIQTSADYRALVKGYEEKLSNNTPQLDQIYDLLQANVRIALMCFEKESERCHRGILCKKLTKTYIIRSEDL
jgi:uncharacterized protein (DUF488 family)